MKKIRLIAFDLDGTLIDSKEDIANSVHFTMKTLGLPPIPNDVIYSYVGHGVGPLIEKSVNTSNSTNFPQALQIFKSHYLNNCLNLTKVFPGVIDILEYYKHLPKVVITNKAQIFSEKIIQGLQLSHYFKGVYGGDTQFPKKPDPTLLSCIMSQFNSPKEETLMVGDSDVDIQTGKNAGTLTCGVTYGFRPLKELEETHSDYLINSIIELKSLFHV